MEFNRLQGDFAGRFPTNLRQQSDRTSHGKLKLKPAQKVSHLVALEDRKIVHDRTAPLCSLNSNINSSDIPGV